MPKQGSQEQLLKQGCWEEGFKQGSQEEVRKQGFPVAPGNFALEPALPGNAFLRTCSCEPCSCLEPCLETVPGTLLGNRFWEPYLQAVPKNLTALLGTSSWIPAWEPLPGNLLGNVFPQQRKLGVFSHPKNKISNQIFQEQVRKQCYQERFPSQVPKNSSPGKVPKQGFQKQLSSKVPRNRFPSKVPRNRFPRKGCKKSLQE